MWLTGWQHSDRRQSHIFFILSSNIPAARVLHFTRSRDPTDAKIHWRTDYRVRCASSPARTISYYFGHPLREYFCVQYCIGEGKDEVGRQADIWRYGCLLYTPGCRNPDTHRWHCEHGALAGCLDGRVRLVFFFFFFSFSSAWVGIFGI
ncbi:uncharacterized protein P884DRAFT_2865 [Thermothelomyces heterothallicus CBS 202.75]|uniref:uncharacterized protein n=1 Tax=Thermothelomyces heterothallicus CBS 202.75 TaxID=1149848 RepID=UPI003743C73B